MIFPIQMFGCKCDNCGEIWYDGHNGYMAFTDEISMKDNVMEDDSWYCAEDGKHFCPQCFISIDDDDNIILDNLRATDQTNNTDKKEK